MTDVIYELMKTILKIVEENSAQIDALHDRLLKLEER